MNECNREMIMVRVSVNILYLYTLNALNPNSNIAVINIIWTYKAPFKNAFLDYIV